MTLVEPNVHLSLHMPNVQYTKLHALSLHCHELWYMQSKTHYILNQLDIYINWCKRSNPIFCEWKCDIL